MSGSRILSGLVAGLWLAAPVLLAQDKARDPWRDFDLAEVRVGRIVLRYQKLLQPKMDGIRATMADFAKKEAAHFAWAKRLRDRSARIIEQVNAIVGFSPSAEQKAEQQKLFSGFLDMTTVLRLTRPGRKSTFYLITAESAKDYVRKGGKLPGFTYDKATDKVTYEFRVGRTSRDTAPPKEVELVLPVEADTAGQMISEMLGAIGRKWGTMTAGMAVHELAEWTIVAYRLKPRDAHFRWFSDGFANAAAIHVLRSSIGEKAAAEFAKAFDIAERAALAKKINLQYWLAANQCIFPRDWSGPIEAESDLNDARYSFATHEAMRLIDKHGIECVAKILHEACAPNRGASREDILAAVKAATGEDIAKRLLRYQSFKTRQEGLEVYTKRYEAATARKDHQEALTALLRMHELRKRRDMAVFAQVAELLSKLGHEAAGKRVLERGELCKKEAAAWCRKAAEGGDPEAMFKLGAIYYHGEGVEKDLAEALNWYRKAAEAGHASAMFNLAVMYHQGKGVKREPHRAVKWYRKAAEFGRLEAMFNLGRMYCDGDGVERDPIEAVRWFRKAAEGREPRAMYNLAVMYHQGKGVKRDPAEAVKWFRKAAEGGDPEAMFRLGAIYYHGEGVEKDLAEALNWYRKAAEAGHASAMFNLAVMYHQGEGVKRNPAEAVKWFRKAAEAGGPAGMNRMGLWYAQGKLVKKDLAEAVRWYRKAAEGGFVPAMHNLADAYERGLGVKKDKAEAARWYREAAEARKRRGK